MRVMATKALRELEINYLEKQIHKLKKELENKKKLLEQGDIVKGDFVYKKNGLLYKKVSTGGRYTLAVYIPTVKRTNIVLAIHERSGHIGMSKTIKLAKNLIYFPEIDQFIQSLIKSYPVCQWTKVKLLPRIQKN
eukprot:NODE_326_length_9650_cov_0.368129.p3 type:complete len:135 gc:universal NODE_326_length_9650_cov_0.368129:5015-5419(+)